MKISVVIPCYNERRTLAQVVRSVRGSSLQNLELVVVDDGSSDGSRTLLQTELAPLIDRVVLHERNRGKGAALRSGFAVATGEIILVQDADMEYSPGDYPILIAPILAGKADAVFGSRFLENGRGRAIYLWQLLGNRFITWLTNYRTGLFLTDIETGCKAFRAAALKKIAIEEDRFGFEPEITMKLAGSNCRIFEVQISYRARTYAEGKKATWRDGFRAIYAIGKYGGGRSTR